MITPIVKRIFIKNWPRKLVALVSALVIWFLVNDSITITRPLNDVAVRVVNLPPEKTVLGMMPNGLLNKKINLTISGKKSLIEDLEPSEVEVVINAAGKKESFVAEIDKKSLVSLVPGINLKEGPTKVEAYDLLVTVSNLVTMEIPVYITTPHGDPPKGYQFLDVWPRHLVQKVSGPEEQVEQLRKEGLNLTFDLCRITEQELEAIKSLNSSLNTDEISFYVPEEWKEVPIPFRDNAKEPLNDPRSAILKIDFLEQEFIPVSEKLPVTVYFPVKSSSTVNPNTYQLATNDLVESKNGVTLLDLSLYVKNVSRLFLDIVRDNIELVIVATPKKKELDWTIVFIDEKALENAFVEAFIHHDESKKDEGQYSEQALRNRFQNYARNFILYTKDERPLQLKVTVSENQIHVTNT